MSKSPKRRNPHAYNPIMRKGGVHQKSNGALRAASKRKWKEQSRANDRDFIYDNCFRTAA